MFPSEDEASRKSSPRSLDRPPRRSRGRRRNRRQLSLGLGPFFLVMAGFIALFLLLNLVLHSRLEEYKSHGKEETSEAASGQASQGQVTTETHSQDARPRHQGRRRFVPNQEELDSLVAAAAATEEKPKEHYPLEPNKDPGVFPVIAVESSWHEGDDHIGQFLYNFRGAVENGKPAQKHESTEIIDMRQLASTLPFDNPDGGAWKQGWDVQPRPVSEENPLTVFVVPHSHNDPGWIKTFDDYFRTQTTHIITTVVEALEMDPQRRFIWAEISYFSWWWKEQDLAMRNRALKVLDNGQLEFVTGGWVMPDEANSDIYALEVQMQEGHTWIRENLGPQYVPKYGWSIDPFGYSPTMPYVLHNFDFEGILIQRVHYAVKKELAQRKHLEFYWRQTWDKEGTYDMFTHVMPFYSYDIPHTCGPDPSVCCQFDYGRSPFGRYGACPWHESPVAVTAENVAERAHLLVDQYLKKANLYRGNAVLVPLGDDFRYQGQKEAEDQYNNYAAIMKYANENIPGVTVQFGTLREYFEKIKGTFEPPILKGSFFTYSDVNQDYWSGYFTSRVFDKALDRQLERALYATDALGATPTELRGPRRELSLFQHHDGVTGTAKTHVVEDYAKRLYESIGETHKLILDKLAERYPELRSIKGSLEQCWQAPAPRGYIRNLCAEEGPVVAFNPLEHSQMCGSQKIPGKSAATVRLPCETPGPLAHSFDKVEFDPETGLMTSPLQEKWMVWKVKKGGAYLFFPDKLEKHVPENVKISDGGWVVDTPAWKRTLIQRTSTKNETVFDFLYDINLWNDNQEWFVRFDSDIQDGGVFHTDLNGFNFDTHYFRKDLPIQSQVFPMPTHASIQDSHTRLTVLSEHAQGTASLQSGAIDVFLDRRLRQDDNRGVGQGVKDNARTRTRLRVVMERQEFPTEGEFQITPACRKEWNMLNHPLEIYGVPLVKF